jgi:hypothetical protein
MHYATKHLNCTFSDFVFDKSSYIKNQKMPQSPQKQADFGCTVKQIDCPRILALFCEPKLAHNDSQKDKLELHAIQRSIMASGSKYKDWLNQNA